MKKKELNSIDLRLKGLKKKSKNKKTKVKVKIDYEAAKQMIACCRSENEASRRMQMACGFRYDHTEERVDPRDGKPYLMEYNLYER